MVSWKEQRKKLYYKNHEAAVHGRPNHGPQKKRDVIQKDSILRLKRNDTEDTAKWKKGLPVSVADPCPMRNQFYS